MLPTSIRKAGPLALLEAMTWGSLLLDFDRTTSHIDSAAGMLPLAKKRCGCG
jgi:hypothetical protein